MSESISPITYGIFQSPANVPLIERLTSDGEKVYLLPRLFIERTVGRFSFVPAEYDWMVFADVFGVDAFLERFREDGGDLFELDDLIIFANGEAVADRLRFEQIHADVIPVRASTDAWFEAIRQYNSEKLEGWRFLVVGGKDEPAIVRQLRESGGKVSYLQVYEAAFEGSPAHALALLTGGAVDRLILTSPDDVFGFLKLAEDHPTAKLPTGIGVFVTNETVFRAARENGLRPLYLPPE